MDIRSKLARGFIVLALLCNLWPTGQTNLAVAAGGSKNGAAGQMPAFYDGELFTVNMKEMPGNASGSLIGNNQASTKSMLPTIWMRNRISFPCSMPSRVTDSIPCGNKTLSCSMPDLRLTNSFPMRKSWPLPLDPIPRSRSS